MRVAPGLCAVLLTGVHLTGCLHRESSEEEFRQTRELMRAEQFDRALPKAHAGVADAERRQDSIVAWRFRNLEAEILLGQRQPKKAMELLAKEPPEGPPWAEIQGRALLLKGQAAYLLSDYTTSQELLGRAAQAAQQAKSASLAAEVELRQGSLLVRLSKFEDADAAFRHAQEAELRLNDPYLAAFAMGNLGFSLMTQSRYDEAIPWFDRAQEIFSKLGTVESVARAAGNSAWCYFRLGDFERAQAGFEQSERAFAQTGNRFEQQIRLGDAGDVAFQAEDYQGAIRQYQSALAVSRGLQADLWTTLWLNNLARTCIELADWECAEKSNRESAEVQSRLPNAASKVYSLYNSARIAAGRKQFKEAEQLYQQALRETPEDPTTILAAQTSLADLYLETGRSREAESEFRSAFAGIDRRSASLVKVDYRFSYVASLIKFYSRYIDHLIETHQPGKALEFADASRSRVLSQRSGRTDTVQTRTAEDYRGLARTEHATLIEYWIGWKKSYGWVITPSQVKCFELPPRDQLRSWIEQYSKPILASRNPLDAAPEAGQKLFQALLNSTGSGKRFIVVPDGELHGLNFESLPSPEDPKKFWIEQAVIAIAPSFNYLLSAGSMQKFSDRGNLLAFGDPEPVLPQYPHLDFAAQEIDSVSGSIKSSRNARLTGAQAIPAAYAASRPEQFEFIHFAAHAAANPESPLDSAVILSGPPDRCKLFARDVMQVPLHAELVTISACRTAAARTYAGEGPVGLAWAFLRAGAKSVIAGLWDVNDRSTAQLMAGLYRRIASGSSPGDALRATKLEMIHGGGAYAKPFYWAPFQLYAGARL